MASLVTPLLWSFVPSQLANVLLPYASQIVPSLFPPAPKGSPIYARNYRWVYTTLIVGYLAYTWTSGDNGDDWYAMLGVPRWADDDDLKKSFRTLSRRYHPDRSSDVRDGEVFIILRRAYETLSNPTTRFAFDRFGPDVLTWGLEGTRPDSRTGGKKDVGIREWMIAGLMRSVGFYIFSGGIMALLAVVGKAREGASYRILLLLLLLTAELTLVLAPTSPPYASSLIDILPGLPAPLHATLRPVLGPLQAAISLPFSSFIASPQFLQVRTLHRLFTTLSIGISQLAGVWTTREPTAEEALVQATMMAKRLEMDSVGDFQRDLLPALQTGQLQQMQALLKAGMQEALVNRSLSQHPGIRPVWTAAYTRAATSLQSIQGLGGQRELELARRIPLPPSPPPSPRLSARELS